MPIISIRMLKEPQRSLKKDQGLLTTKMSMTREEKLKYITEHYMPHMWRKAYSVISDAHEAEDACQEAFIKLMRVVDNIENIEETRVRALCVIAAKNTAIDILRKKGREIPSEDIIPELDGLPGAATENPELKFESDEGVRLLMAEINKLPEQYRDVIMLRCLNELTALETAEILKCSANTVNIRLTRARKLLKKRLGEQMQKFQ